MSPIHVVVPCPFTIAMCCYITAVVLVTTSSFLGSTDLWCHLVFSTKPWYDKNLFSEWSICQSCCEVTGWKVDVPFKYVVCILE